jgi:murein DD-endopeptidase MepM/ murein hydrolase activator NlpD
MNLFDNSDSEPSGFKPQGPDAEMAGVEKSAIGFVTYFKKSMIDAAKSVSDAFAKAKKDSDSISKNLTGGSKGKSTLDMPDMPTGSGMGVLGKVGMGVMAAGSLGMGLMPSTASAVALRTSADTIAGLSGMSASGVMRQSNRLVGNGATSATSPTMAAMTVAYTGGYLANTLSSKNIMSQVGGLSALTGMTNEQAAASAASANGMSFLRMGVRIRDSNGQLLPMNQIINSVWNFIYRGKNDITKEQAMMLLNPGSPGGNAIRQVAGDPGLANEIIMGIVARAKNGGKALSSSSLSGSTNALNMLGVAKGAPIRTAFNYNTSQSNLTTATQGGLVSGYTGALDAATAANNGLTAFANQLPQVTDLLGKLKGVLQTFPGLGGVGGTVSSLGGLGASLLMQRAGNKALLSGLEGVIGKGDGTVAAEGGGLLSGLGKGLGKGIPILGALLSAYSGYKDRKGHKGFNWSSLLKNAGIGAAGGGIFGGLPGALVGGLVGGGGDLIGQLFGSGGPNTSHTQVGSGISNAASDAGMPVSGSPTITAGFGNRKGGKGIKAGFHPGVDFGVKPGTAVTAAADGVVSYVGNSGGYGNHVIINHGNKQSLYAHLKTISVRQGQQVKRGDVIGHSGGVKGAPGAGNSTGPHLHFEIRDKNGRSISPLAIIKANALNQQLNPKASDNDTTVMFAGAGVISGKNNALGSTSLKDLLASGDAANTISNGILSNGGKAYSNGQVINDSGIILGTGDSRSWAKSLLQKLKYPTTSDNIKALTTWAAWEGGQWHNSAHYNPLNTEQPATGATNMNNEGVKSYTSWSQGYQATIETLKNGRYGPILSALKKGNNTMSVLKAVNHSPWGTYIPGAGGPNTSPAGVAVATMPSHSTSSSSGTHSTNINARSSIDVNVGINLKMNHPGTVATELIINAVNKAVADKLRKEQVGRY